jgi:MarR family transcriptional regulator, transcriptional regulator for hemolysin
LKILGFSIFIKITDISIIFVSMNQHQEKLDQIIFYTLEKASKSYRQFAQRIITDKGYPITIDQWLVLKALQENPEQNQHRIAETVFKDYASLTRMIELLVEKKYLERTMHATDRRRFNLKLTDKACELLEVLQPIIEQYRSAALENISSAQIAELNKCLNGIIRNCKN